MGTCTKRYLENNEDQTEMTKTSDSFSVTKKLKDHFFFQYKDIYPKYLRSNLFQVSILGSLTPKKHTD